MKEMRDLIRCWFINIIMGMTVVFPLLLAVVCGAGADSPEGQQSARPGAAQLALSPEPNGKRKDERLCAAQL